MSSPFIDPEHYDAQLARKHSTFVEQFADLNLPQAEIFPSAPRHYRMRAEFRLWHHGDAVDFAMFNPETPRQPILLDDFPVACERICAAMPRLKALLHADPALKKRIYAVDFLATQSDELLVTLIYHRKLDNAWTEAARQVAKTLNAQVIGRSRGQKIVLERDWLLEAFDFHGRRLVYQQFENSFTQPNAGVNQHMLSWAARQTAACPGDLLELYCGNGNFTVALAPYFRQILATEVSKTSVAAAQYNFTVNSVDNVKIARLASEEISAALAGEATFQRLKDIDLGQYQFSTLLVDPPRAGLDAGTLALAADFEQIIYISCNPATLHDNLQHLTQSHDIRQLALFDQFPYTHHLECGVFLTRKTT